MTSRSASIVGAAALALTIGLGYAAGEGRPSAEPLRAAMDLSLDALDTLPRDPSNRWSDDPRAADLGHRLFFDPRLSGDGGGAEHHS